jgi:aerobic carbon-monoxide dehydrogenase medium subunit
LEAALISAEIDFLAPQDLAAALAVLDEHEDDATVLSGGMSLVPMMNLGLASPEHVLSLRRIRELTDIRDDGDAIVLGGMVPHAVVATHPAVRESASSLAVSASLIGDVQVRNRGTIGGSIAHADPAADYLPALVALGGEIVLESARDGRRTVPASEFFIDAMLTVRQGHELVTAVRVPKLAQRAVSEYIRFARVEGSFAIVNAAVTLDPEGDARIALGGVGPAPVTLDITSFGRGGWDDSAAASVGDAAFDACVDVQGDIMSDAEYRREMARVHARRVVSRAAARLGSPADNGSAKR